MGTEEKKLDGKAFVVELDKCKTPKIYLRCLTGR